MDAPAHPHRWFYPAPAWLVYGAAAATGVLFASERWRWFFFNEHKGWTVLLAVAFVGVVFLLLLAWLLLALLFRRRFQFGLRTLLVFVTLCALVCSWFAVRLRDARQQARLVAAIQKNHLAYVFYEGTKRGTYLLDDPSKPEPLRKLLGVDFFYYVTELNIAPMRPVSDAELAQFAELTELRLLSLDGDDVTDEVLSHLKGLTNLRYLTLDDCNVTREGVEKLRQALPKCKIKVVPSGKGEP